MLINQEELKTMASRMPGCHHGGFALYQLMLQRLESTKMTRLELIVVVCPSMMMSELIYVYISLSMIIIVLKARGSSTVDITEHTKFLFCFKKLD